MGTEYIELLYWNVGNERAFERFDNIGLKPSTVLREKTLRTSVNIIFSRKGFDSTAGGFPSLIFPDNTLFSIPIPSNSSHCDYSRLAYKFGEEPIQSILNQVTEKRVFSNDKRHDCDYAQAEQGCHHDPMYLKESNRLVLGQTERSESHLRNQGVTAGDVFLFYGWFRRVARTGGRWNYVDGAPDVHLIWSWMTVGSACKLDTQEDIISALADCPDLSAHPHLAADWNVLPNSVYVSGEYARLPFSESGCLTDLKSYEGRSKWRLPACFNQPQAFSHLKSFSLSGGEVIVRYRGYGQEFVLDLDKVAEVRDRNEILEFVHKIRTLRD